MPRGMKRRMLRRKSTPPSSPQTMQDSGVAAARAESCGWGRSVTSPMSARLTDGDEVPEVSLAAWHRTKLAPSVGVYCHNRSSEVWDERNIPPVRKADGDGPPPAMIGAVLGHRRSPVHRDKEFR